MTSFRSTTPPSQLIASAEAERPAARPGRRVATVVANAKPDVVTWNFEGLQVVMFASPWKTMKIEIHTDTALTQGQAQRIHALCEQIKKVAEG